MSYAPRPLGDQPLAFFFWAVLASMPHARFQSSPRPQHPDVLLLNRFALVQSRFWQTRLVEERRCGHSRWMVDFTARDNRDTSSLRQRLTNLVVPADEERWNAFPESLFHQDSSIRMRPWTTGSIALAVHGNANAVDHINRLAAWSHWPQSTF